MYSTLNIFSRNVVCRVVTDRPSGFARGVSVAPLPSPPTEVAQTEASSRAGAPGSHAQEAPLLDPPSSLTTIPSYAYLITLLTAFTVIALDVNAEGSLHLFQPVDTFVHTAVSQNIPYDFRVNIADKIISDTPITVGAALIVAGIVAIATKRPQQAASLATLFAFFNFTFGGVGFSKDASATTALKHFFSRARPSDLHHSFSFPSGHSTSVYFILGFLFFIIVPALNSLQSSKSVLSGCERGSQGDSVEPSELQGALTMAARPRNALALTVAGGVVTQNGRLLADVHWVSDVLAGAMWGSTGVATACLVYKSGKMVSQGLSATGTAATPGPGGQGGSGAKRAGGVRR